MADVGKQSAAPTYRDTAVGRNAAAGVTGRPSWSSPQGLYDYIIAHVPGISASAAAWLQGEILGGKNFLADNARLGVTRPGVSMSSGYAYGQQPVSGPTTPTLPYLSADQVSAIMGLQPFAAGAGSHYYGDPAPVPTYYGQDQHGSGGQNLQPVVPGWNPPDSFLHGGYTLPTYGQLGLPTPHDGLVYSGNLTSREGGGPYLAYPPGSTYGTVYGPGGGPDVSGGQPRPVHQPPGEDVGGFNGFDPHPNAGARLAEHFLGGGPNYLDRLPSVPNVNPVRHLLGRFPGY